MAGNIHGGKGLGGKDRICLGVNISKEVHSKLLEAAKAEERSLSDVVRTALRKFLAKQEEA